MAKTLRTLSATGFTTKNATLTFSELDQNFIDLFNESFQVSNNLSEATDLPTLRGNIGLADGSADLDLNSIDINGSTFVDASRNVTGAEGSFTKLGINDTSPTYDVEIVGTNTATSGIKVGTAGYSNLVNPGQDGETISLNARGFGFTFDGNTLSTNVTAGIGVAVSRGDPALAISNTSGRAIHVEDGNVFFGADAIIGNTLTVNSQLLFNLGNEQLLSTDADVTFDITKSKYFDVNANSGITNSSNKLSIGYEGTYGWVQTWNSTPLVLNSLGNNVLIGKTSSTGSLFEVDGTSNFGGDITTQANVADDGFSDWFSVNPAGYQIEGATGIADFRTVFTDELIAKAFTADVAQALAGSDFLTKSVAKVAEDFTIPAVSSSGTLTVEDLEGLEDLQTFEANDWVRIRIVDTTSTPAVIGDVWGQVTSYVDNADGTQDWTFTVDYAGASDVLVGQTVYKGAIVLDYGVSGDTYIERTVLDRSGGSDFSKVPYDRIVRWTGTDPRTGTKEVLVQSGNINGLGGFSSATYGFFAKDNFVVELDGGNMGIGKNVGGAGVDGIHIDADDFWYTDGTGSVGGGILNWDASTPIVNASGWALDADSISKGSLANGEIIISSDNSAGDMGAGGFDTNGAGIPSISIRKQDTGTSDRAYLMIGETFVGGTWTGRMGISFIAAKGQTTPHFELSRDMSGGGITAQIAGINFDSSKLWTGDGTNGYVGLGATSGATDRAFWAGSPNTDGSGATPFFVQQNGKIHYDGIGKILYSRNRVATFGVDNSVTSIQTDLWETEADASIASVTDTDDQDKVEVRFIKRFGEDNIVLSGWADFDQSGDVSSNDSRVYVKVYDDSGTLQVEDFVTVGSTGNTFSFATDISSLSDDTYYTVVINTWATVTSGGSGGATTTTQLREDVFMFTTD